MTNISLVDSFIILLHFMILSFINRALEPSWACVSQQLLDRRVSGIYMALKGTIDPGFMESKLKSCRYNRWPAGAQLAVTGFEPMKP